MKKWLVGIAALGAVAWLLCARILGPSDLWDQSQPLTVGYTTDMLVNENWILPRARGTEPATKPPLYNWLAAPAVAAFGFGSEFAHKLPSVLALIGCVVMVIVIGQCDSTRSHHVASEANAAGWLAAIMLVASYPLFKLGYLARPDMLLVWWLLVAWWSATRLLIDEESFDHVAGEDDRACRLEAASVRGPCEWWLRVIFWLSIAAAGLTKGPVAALPLIFVVFGGWILCDSWRAGFTRLRWWWGLPLVLLINGAWLFAVWRIDLAHLRDTMWANELLGRITGTGPEGARQGPIELLTGILDMPTYFALRFAPWSVPAVIAMLVGAYQWRKFSGQRSVALKWRKSAALFVVIMLVVMSLSAGKRADYIAPAYPMAALLASWWLIDVTARGKESAKAAAAMALAVIIVASIALVVLTRNNLAEPNAPSDEFSEEIERFIGEATREIDARPAVVRFCWTGETHVQAMLGASHKSGQDAVFAEMQHGRPFWVVAGLKTSSPHEFAAWMAERGEPAQLTAVVRSAELPRDRGWPVQMTLYWLEPERN